MDDWRQGARMMFRHDSVIYIKLEEAAFRFYNVSQCTTSLLKCEKRLEFRSWESTVLSKWRKFSTEPQPIRG